MKKGGLSNREVFEEIETLLTDDEIGWLPRLEKNQGAILDAVGSASTEQLVGEGLVDAIRAAIVEERKPQWPWVIVSAVIGLLLILNAVLIWTSGSWHYSQDRYLMKEQLREILREEGWTNERPNS